MGLIVFEDLMGSSVPRGPWFLVFWVFFLLVGSLNLIVYDKKKARLYKNITFPFSFFHLPGHFFLILFFFSYFSITFLFVILFFLLFLSFYVFYLITFVCVCVFVCRFLPFYLHQLVSKKIEKIK